MTRPIGYYVHHQGDGHRQRAIAIGRAIGGNMTLLGTGLSGRSGGLPHIDLPDDRLESDFTGVDHAERPSALHYAPVDHEGIRQRTARVADWIARERPRLIIVDVSVEIAMLARLASVPTVYVRLNGTRTDPPHIDAFRASTALLAPFHEALDDDDTPAWVREKTFYAPAIVEAQSAAPAIEDTILVVIGRGGGVSDGERWAAAARAVPGWRWQVVGPCSVPADPPANLELRGWVEDAGSMIAGAAIVIGAAGDGVVSAVLAHRRPFLCLPEFRPFDEQVSKARRLDALGVAAVARAWPQDGDWPGLLAEAVARASSWPASLSMSGGPDRVARWLDGLVPHSLSDRSRMA